MLPNIQERYYNRRLDNFSPAVGDVERVVKHDEKGGEIITFEPVDYPSIIKTRPVVEMFDLKEMLAAGLDPAVPIHTASGVSRIESARQINDIASEVEKLFDDPSKTELDPSKTE